MARNLLNHPELWESGYFSQPNHPEFPPITAEQYLADYGTTQWIVSLYGYGDLASYTRNIHYWQNNQEGFSYYEGWKYVGDIQQGDHILFTVISASYGTTYVIYGQNRVFVEAGKTYSIPVTESGWTLVVRAGPPHSQDADTPFVAVYFEPAVPDGSNTPCAVRFFNIEHGATATPALNSGAAGTLRLRGAAHEKTAAQLGAMGRGTLRLRSAVLSQAGNDGEYSNTPPPPAFGIGEGTIYLTGIGDGPAVNKPATADGSIKIAGRADQYANKGSAKLRLAGWGHQVDFDAIMSDPVFQETVNRAQTATLYDDVLFDDETDTLGIYRVMSQLRLRERSRMRARIRVVAADTLLLDDQLQLIYRELLEDNLLLRDRLSAAVLLRLHDLLLLNNEVQTSAEAWQRIVEAVALGEWLDALQRVELTDKLALHDQAAHWLRYGAALVDRLLLDDVMVGSATLSAVLPDTLVLADDFIMSAEQMVQMIDHLGLMLHLRLDDGHYSAWTMNTDSRASSRYTDYPFNAFMRVAGKHYGTTDAGLYRLDGDDDDGVAINARIRLGMSALGNRLLKHVPNMYLGYSASGDLLLRVMTAEHNTGERRADIYRLHAKGAASQRDGRVQIGRGLQAVYWDFEIENIDGADFELDSIEFMPLVINRRTRGNAGGR